MKFPGSVPPASYNYLLDLLANFTYQLLQFFVVFLIIQIPEIYFTLTSPLYEPNNPLLLLISFLLILGVSLSNSIILKQIAFSIIYIFQLVWLGKLAYFGSLLTLQDVYYALYERNDFIEGLIYDFDIIVLPVIIISLSVFLAYKFSLLGNDKKGKVSGYLATFLTISLFISLYGFVFTHYDPQRLTPDRHSNSILGTMSVTALYIVDKINDKQFHIDKFYDLKLSQNSDIESVKDDTTIIFIMTESVSANRMQLYGYEEINTPKLVNRQINHDDNLVIIPKLGFSYGVSTIASVPLSLRLSYHPLDYIFRNEGLDVMSKKLGFETSFISAQSDFTFSISGAQAFDHIETRYDWDKEYFEKKDMMILDQIDHNQIKSNKKFYYIQTRVNHVPYDHNCDLRIKNPKVTNNQRVIEYNSGIKCLDEFLDALISKYENTKSKLHIFITSDHNELMGEYGFYAHSILHPFVALVPMIYITNQKDHPLIERFKTKEVLSAFEYESFLIEAMGGNLTFNPSNDKYSKEDLENSFYINGILPFGKAGYMEVKKTLDPSKYLAITYSEDGITKDTEEYNFPQITKILEHLKTYDTKSP